MFLKSILSIIFIFLSLNSAHSAPGTQKEWTRTEILQIADKEAISLGYDIEHMSVSFNVYNTNWRNYLKSLKGIGGLPSVENKLNKHKKYVSVYFSLFERSMRGGDLWVFIDLNTGNIITTVRGE